MTGWQSGLQSRGPIALKRRRGFDMTKSLREAINVKCRECTYDPLDVGGASHQIAACISSDCPLHPVRPITCTRLPLRLLEAWHVHPEQLDARARALVREALPTSEDGQNGPSQSKEEISGGVA